MFANVGFHYSNNYQNMDSATTVATSWGVSYDLNATTSVGWDQELGLMMSFAVPNTGASLRLGWAADNAGTTTQTAGADTPDNADDDVFENDNNGLATETSIGHGYTWWTGGNGIKTSISTNYDYIMAPGALDGGAAADNLDATQVQNRNNLSVVVGFGF
jgi:hypothetical protein